MQYSSFSYLILKALFILGFFCYYLKYGWYSIMREQSVTLFVWRAPYCRVCPWQIEEKERVNLDIIWLSIFRQNHFNKKIKWYPSHFFIVRQHNFLFTDGSFFSYDSSVILKKKRRKYFLWFNCSTQNTLEGMNSEKNSLQMFFRKQKPQPECCFSFDTHYHTRISNKFKRQ